MKALRHISALIALALVMSCSKTGNDTDWSLTKPIGIKKMDFTRFGDSLVETFSVNLNQKTPSVKTAKNTQITIPNDAFLNRKGEIISGQITLIVRELHLPSEMLLSDKPALNTDGGILESYGEFNIPAFQNGEPLQLSENKVLNITTSFNNKNNPTNMPI